MKKHRAYYEENARLYLAEARLSSIERSVSIAYAWNKLRRMIFELFDINRYQSVLDIGCGPGSNLLRLVNKTAICISFDIAQSMVHFVVNYARELKVSHKYFLLVADAQYLPFKDDAFDVVLCSEVLEHLPFPRKSVHEIYRVIKPRGFTVITTPNRNEPLKLLANYVLRISLIGTNLKRKFAYKPSKAEQLLSKLEMKYGVQHHEVEFTLRELKLLLKSTGFTLEEVRGGSINPYPIAGYLDRHQFIFRLFQIVDEILDSLGLTYLKWTIIMKGRKTNR